MPELEPLPIDDRLAEIREAVRTRGAAVVVAPPGAGKTTRVAPALVADGPVILLQPRRVAARSLARRIAAERGWTVGEEIGWQVRFERRFSARTRLLVATEGVLTARLQRDPLLGEFRTAVLDEFHERSLHADLALALVRQAREARDDLRVVVMSATLDARAVADFLNGCPVLEVAGRPHPVEVGYAPALTPVVACRRALEGTDGHVLCFLPGAPEIERARSELREVAGGGAVDVLPLHGGLDADAQDAALAAGPRRKLILSTNLAETSLTVEGVTSVVDSGLHKVLRRDAALGIDRLETERISADSAEQRSGRAGRTGPGVALRLWDPRDRLRPHREPEIERVELSGPFLEVLAWGGDPRRFEWFEPPPEEAGRAALELLERLGAVAGGRITELGQALRRLPLHPRLGRLLLGAGGSRESAAACAALAEGWTRHDVHDATACDLLPLADRVVRGPRHVRRAAAEYARAARRAGASSFRVAGRDAEETLRRAVLAAYPDRVARRRRAGSRRLVLASGHGAVLAPQSGVHEGRFLVAVELRAGPRGPGSEARVRLASRVEPDRLEPTHRDLRHELEAATGAVRAHERSWYERVPLDERPAAPDAEIAAGLLAEAMLRRGLGDGVTAALRRLRFAGIEVDVAALLRRACHGRTGWFEFDLLDALGGGTRQRLDRLAPATFRAPSGRSVRLEYRDDGSVHAAVKLQELFGLAETPRIGERSEPLTLSLLAPNGRPVQTTRDLRSFWSRTYPEVRRELRGRYPKHPWPQDPWAARPTAGLKRRRR